MWSWEPNLGVFWGTEVTQWGPGVKPRQGVTLGDGVPQKLEH